MVGTYMKKHTVRIEPLGQVCEVPHGTPLRDVLRGMHADFPCGGRGQCGKCRVRLLSGQVSVDGRHATLLAEKGLDTAWRMACLSRVEDDLSIEVPQPEMQILTAGGGSFSFLPESGYGVAVDLGSTTVVAQLVSLADNRVVRTVTEVNPQIAWGADIISRISYALQSAAHLVQLRDAVRTCVGRMIETLLEEAEAGAVRKVVMAGNTAMHHLFAGYDVAPLAAAPYQSPQNAGFCLTADELGWRFLSPCTVEFLPNLSHFVGSDLLCGILACGISAGRDYSLLIDLGTNGEMALGNGSRIVYTSTAAGPAFEGVNISCGMRAVAGAVYAVEEEAGGRRCLTVGGCPPAGICGSGLVEAVCSLVSGGEVDMTGAMTRPDCTEVELAPGVKLTGNDIREFQLAKAALAAGMQL